MAKEPGRPPHGLAGVIQDVVETRQPLGKEPREQIHAGRMAQYEEPEHVQAPAKSGSLA